MKNEREIKRYKGQSKFSLPPHIPSHITQTHIKYYKEENGEWRRKICKEITVENFPDLKTDNLKLLA